MSQWPTYPLDPSDPEPSGLVPGSQEPGGVPRHVEPVPPVPQGVPQGAVPEGTAASTWKEIGEAFGDAVSSFFTASSVPEPTLPVIAAAPGYDPRAPMVYSAGGGTVRVSGEWTVPPYMTVRGGMGSIVLDMQRATVVTDVVCVTVRGGMGSILIVVPDGWAADVSTVGTGLGSRKSTVSQKQLVGYPILLFTGSMSTGSMRIRYPNRWDLWRRKREEQREKRIIERAYR